MQDVNIYANPIVCRCAAALGALALLVGLWQPAAVAAEPCEPVWEAGECPPWMVQSSTPAATVRAAVWFDDGSGEAMYVGGRIVGTIGCATGNSVLKWDGSAWSVVGELPDRFEVRTLAIYDRGSGPELYAGGTVHSSGQSPFEPNKVVYRFDGSAWHLVGDGLNPGYAFAEPLVQQLVVFDDGDGPMLYACGSFSVPGHGQPFFQLVFARTDGVEWYPIATIPFTGGTGRDRAFAMQVVETENGPRLYTAVGNGRVYVLSGNQWSVIGNSGLQFPSKILAHDDGNGKKLYFSSPNGFGITRMGIEGGQSEPLPTTTHAQLNSWDMEVFDLGDGPKLYIAGDGVHQWDGQHLTTLLPYSAINSPLYTLAMSVSNGIRSLWAMGQFSQLYGRNLWGFMMWNGEEWGPIGGHVYGNIQAFEMVDFGQGEEVYAAGSFIGLGGESTNRFIARRQGGAWSSLGGGLNGNVRAMRTIDFGQGPMLLVAGSFTEADGQTTDNIAAWNGTEWTSMFSVVGTVEAMLTTHCDAETRLYVAGTFSSVDGQEARQIAVFDGQAWSPLSTGTNSSIYAMVEFDDGSGPAIYAAGSFSFAGGEPAQRIARWDGAQWFPLGPGLGTQGQVNALTVFDDGSSPALYAGGNFNATPGQPNAWLARWDGQQWSSVGGGINGSLPNVTALRVIDTGSGPTLYVSGTFTEAGGVAVQNLAIYDHDGWRAAPGGPSHPADAIAFFEDDLEPTIFLGGAFTHIIDPDGATIPSATLATLRLCPATANPCPADLTGPALDGEPDEIVSTSDLNYYLMLWLAQDSAADIAGPQHEQPDGLVDASDLETYVAWWLTGLGSCP